MFEEAFPECIKRKHAPRNIIDTNPINSREEIIDKIHHNKLTSLGLTAERNYFEEQFDINKYDLRKSWKTLERENSKYENNVNGNYYPL